MTVVVIKFTKTIELLPAQFFAQKINEGFGAQNLINLSSPIC